MIFCLLWTFEGEGTILKNWQMQILYQKEFVDFSIWLKFHINITKQLIRTELGEEIGNTYFYEKY